MRNRTFMLALAGAAIFGVAVGEKVQRWLDQPEPGVVHMSVQVKLVRSDSIALCSDDVCIWAPRHSLVPTLIADETQP